MARTGHAVVYPDMADNLNKVPFDVKVEERYTPVMHKVFLTSRKGEDGIEIPPPPPIRQISEGDLCDLCKARYPITFIIDALVNGFYIEFCNPDDMDEVKEWIKLYLDQCEGIDLSAHPDRIAFNKNAERALAMLNSNLKQRDDYEALKHPKALDIQDLLSLM